MTGKLLDTAETHITIKKEDRRRARKKKAILANYFKATGSISRLCSHTQISRPTFYRWLKEDPEFAARIADQEEALLDYAESCLFTMMNKDIPAAVIFYLKTKGKHRGYVERIEEDFRGQMNVTREIKMTVIHTREDDTEFLKEFEAEINREVEIE